MDENIGDTSSFSSGPNLSHERERQRGKARSEGPYRALLVALEPSCLPWEKGGGRGVLPGTSPAALQGICWGSAGGGRAGQVQSSTAILIRLKRVFVG